LARGNSNAAPRVLPNAIDDLLYPAAAQVCRVNCDNGAESVLPRHSNNNQPSAGFNK
jgi:hypothetical protein